MSRVQDASSVRNHRLSVDQFQALCGGGGGAEVVRELRGSQRSRRLLLIDEVIRTAMEDPALLGPLPPADEAWSALATAPGVDDVLLHPQVGGWAAYVLRRHRGRVTSDAPPWIDFGVLHAVALVAAARAGLSWETRVPARSGRVMLPTLGMAHLDTDTPWSFTPARCAGGVIHLARADGDLAVPATGSGQADAWWPLRRLSSGRRPALSVFLDDVDPYRELADPVPPDRLPAADAARWQTLLDDAWTLLCRRHGETAEAMAAGVMALVPLPGGGLETRSASSGEAFGSVLMSPPADGTDLAVSLVHEFQHIKLGALMHLGRLTHGPDAPVRYAPWRDDPRPLTGLLQGTYAFAGITAFWRHQRPVVAPADRPVADFEYAYARDQVARALAEIRRADGLTEWGHAVADGLTARWRSWQDDRVPADTRAAAGLMGAVHRAGWRLRHLVPADDYVLASASAWAGREPPTRRPYTPTVRPGPPVRWSSGWQMLTRRRAAGQTTVLTDTLRAFGMSAADVALANGRHTAAQAAYQSRMAAGTDSDATWTGLAASAAPGSALRRRPELVRAVYRELSRRGVPADPAELGRWLVGSEA